MASKDSERFECRGAQPQLSVSSEPLTPVPTLAASLSSTSSITTPTASSSTSTSTISTSTSTPDSCPLPIPHHVFPLASSGHLSVCMIPLKGNHHHHQHQHQHRLQQSAFADSCSSNASLSSSPSEGICSLYESSDPSVSPPLSKQCSSSGHSSDSDSPSSHSHPSCVSAELCAVLLAQEEEQQQHFQQQLQQCVVSNSSSSSSSNSGCCGNAMLVDGGSASAASSSASSTTSSTSISSVFSVLFVDVRPQRSFTAGHVRGSINTCCSVLQLRRLDSGRLSVESIFGAKQRQAFTSAKDNHALIVLYDDQCDLPEGPLPSGGGLLSVLLRRISEDHPNVRYLNGGLNEFVKQYPNLVDKSTTVQTPLMLPGCDEGRVRLPSLSSIVCPSTPAHMPPTQVDSYLYLGTQEDSKNRALLDKLNIRYILNVTPDCLNHFESGSDDFHYKRIPIKDTWNQNIAQWFDESFAFIEEARRQGSSVLVHCMAGISRSATIVLAYIMRKKKMPLNTSYNFLKGIRCTISPNLDFMGHLLQYERVLGIEQDSDDSSDSSTSSSGSSGLTTNPVEQMKVPYLSPMLA